MQQAPRARPGVTHLRRQIRTFASVTGPDARPNTWPNTWQDENCLNTIACRESVEHVAVMPRYAAKPAMCVADQHQNTHRAVTPHSDGGLQPAPMAMIDMRSGPSHCLVPVRGGNFESPAPRAPGRQPAAPRCARSARCARSDSLRPGLDGRSEPGLGA